MLAGFGPSPESAWEDFERWFEWLGSLHDIVVVLAFFGAGDGFESFEKGWANAAYIRELPPAQLARCALGDDEIEDFEAGWSNAPFDREWDEVAALVGLFQGEPREGFEAAWRSNEAYARSWSAVASSVAPFSGGAKPVEDFESAWTTAITL